MLDHLQLNAVPGGCGFSGFSGISLIDISQLHMISGDRLHLLGQVLNLLAVLLAGRSDMQGQQVSQRINRRMHFRSLAPLGPIVSGSRTGLRRGLDGNLGGRGRRARWSFEIGFSSLFEISDRLPSTDSSAGEEMVALTATIYIKVNH